jgi:type I restriction enzyme, S subunit
MSESILLKKAVSFSKERISVNSVSIDSYVTTDNLLPNKQGITRAVNLPPQAGNMPAYSCENILLGNIRPYLKKIWFSDRSGGCSADVLVFKVKPEYFPKFIYYALFRDDFFSHVMKGAKGTKMPRGDKAQMLEFTIPKIGFDEQKIIAAVLSALDAKINCNNRINAELEAMAKTLYDYWFVQFDFPDANGKPYKSSGGQMVYNSTLKREIPAGWKDSNILAVADLLGGGTPTKKKPEYWSGDIPFFTPTDADGTIFKFSTADSITEEGLKGSSTKLFGKHTVFITARGSVGKLVLAGVDMAMNQSCYALRAKPDVSHIFLFFLAKELIHHLQVKSSGSVFDSIVSNDIELTWLAIPQSQVIEKFAAVVEPAFEKIANNTKENQHLAQLRDWLLPMLMNGQVTVV